jgi:hypothetical protein
MVLQRKRSLFLCLGLTLVLVVALPATASAVSTLTGETLSGSSSSGNSIPNGVCLNTPYSVSGTATAPYLGTFTETGTFSTTVVQLSATFTITSGTTTVTGSKSAPPGGSLNGALCLEDANGRTALALAPYESIPYTATIHTPNGNFHDEGTSTVTVNVRLDLDTTTLTESFASSLTAPVLITPTTKDQCKNNGWKNFPQFKNQGQCVSFVESKRQT